MTIAQWNPRTRTTKQEDLLLKRSRKKRKLFAFLREHRAQLFDDAFQEELARMYRDTGAGKDAAPPAQMAMALVMQGYLGLSDSDAVEATVIDLRWQMVLDCLGATAPAFSQGALFDFRQRMIAHDMDRRLLERTAELARSSKGFDAKRIPKTLRIATDSSPLEGAGRVEDSINLIGHAARKVVECAAELVESSYEDLCRKAGIPLLLETSIKKALDRDWSDSEQKAEAVDVLARQVLSLERWLTNHLAENIDRPPLNAPLKVLRQFMEQDLEPDPGGGGGMRIIDGVAKDRRISVEEGDMRHGRKSKSKRIDGYKRHVAMDLDSKAILACSVTPANQPEHEALPDLKSDIDAQGIRFSEFHFDRGYMGSPTVGELAEAGVVILCKPWKARNGDLFSKEEFVLELRGKTITCPAGESEPIEFGKTVQFDAEACDVCPRRVECTSAAEGNGRTVSITKDERLQKRLRAMANTKAGRQTFRERVPVEHSLAHIGQRQGRRARYGSTRKNLYDLRRAASIQNLEIVQRNAA
ncbi:MAG: IS1182 family transposase [bacterium]|nr:IS1182 family transposase [bacterium]